MAEKRMLSKKVLDTDAFLDMPLSAQALYFHLVINADDEGFVGNPKRIRDYIGAAESDLDLLIEKRFVISFKSGVIVIRHWKIHNTLRRDRSHPTLFAEEKAGLIVEDNGAYSDRFFDSIHVNQTVTALQPNDNHVSTEDKIEEDRLKEDKGEEVNTPENEDPNPSKRFRKPSISDIAAYCAANGYKLDANRFYDYYESNGWRVGKTPIHAIIKTHINYRWETGMVIRKEDTPQRLANRRYEEKNKQKRREACGNFQTMIPRELYEEINAFLKENKITKVKLIEAGYAALRDEIVKLD